MPNNYRLAALVCFGGLLLFACADHRSGAVNYVKYLLPVGLIVAFLYLYRRTRRFDAYLSYPLVLDGEALVELAGAFARVHPCWAFNWADGTTSNYVLLDDNQLLLHPLGTYGAHYELCLQGTPTAVRIRCRSARTNGPLYPLQRSRFLATIYTLLAARKRGLDTPAVGEQLHTEALDAHMTAGLWRSGRGWRYLLSGLLFLLFTAIGTALLITEEPSLMGLLFVAIPVILGLLYVRSELREAGRRRAYRAGRKG